MKTPRKKNENIRALSDQDLYLFNEGNHLRLYDRMGAHPGKDGTRFAVWAPNAKSVHVIGDFNGWDRGSHPLAQRGYSGIWEGIIPGVRQGQNYKYSSPPATAATPARRQIPSPSQPKSPPRPHPSSGTWTTSGPTATG
jgi:1,4-alpha-glucan branching enzyme